MPGHEEAGQIKRQGWGLSRDWWTLTGLIWLESAYAQHFVEDRGWDVYGCSLVYAVGVLLYSRLCKPISSAGSRRAFWVMGALVLVLDALLIRFGPPDFSFLKGE